MILTVSMVDTDSEFAFVTMLVNNLIFPYEDENVHLSFSFTCFICLDTPLPWDEHSFNLFEYTWWY